MIDLVQGALDLLEQRVPDLQFRLIKPHMGPERAQVCRQSPGERLVGVTVTHEDTGASHAHLCRSNRGADVVSTAIHGGEAAVNGALNRLALGASEMPVRVQGLC